MEDADYSSKYSEGSLVWAKVSGYPWWPAMVERDPDFNAYYDSGIGLKDFWFYHVVFLDKEVTRAWIPETHLRPYRGKEKNNRLSQQEKQQMSRCQKLLNQAISTADSATLRSVEERLEMFAFKTRYTPKKASAGFAVKRKKKSRNADGKNVKGEKKGKKMSKTSESPKRSSSTSSHENLSLHGSTEKTHGVLEVIEGTSLPQTIGDLQTPADKSNITSDGKTKGKKRIKKKDSVGKEKLGSGVAAEIPEGVESTSVQENLSLHGSTEKTHGVLGVIEGTSLPQTIGDLQTPADKSKIICDGKTKKKKRIKKKDSVGKEKLGSGLAAEIPEGVEFSLINFSSAKKVSVRQEAEKTKKRKGSKLDMEGKSELKKPKIKKSKRQLQEDGISSHQVLGKNKASGDLDMAQQQYTNSTSQDISPEEDEMGKEGLSKLEILKTKKPKFVASPLVSTKCDLVAHSPQSIMSNLSNPVSPSSASKKEKHDSEGSSKPKKAKFGTEPQNSSQSDSQSSNSDNPSSPNLAANKHEIAEESSKPKKPKKPKFGARVASTLKCSEKLSDLAQELGEIMKKTKNESSAAEELQIPVIKPKKAVPVFGKTAQRCKSIEL